MRKSYLLYALGAGLAFSACSSEENIPQQSDVLEKGTSFYVNVAITTNSDMGGTRAYDGTDDPGFEQGLDTESDVNTVYFVFYDSNGVVVGQPVSVSVDDLGTATEGSPTGSILRSYTSIVQVDVNRGESKPAQVMCYVNPVSTERLANSLQNIETITREVFNDGDGGFSMSNSVYYPNSDGGTSLIRAVEIDPTQLFISKDKAEEAVEKDESAARVVINVERYAAKVNFAFAKEDVVTDYVPANTAVTLTFVPEKWDVNATDRNTFVTKAFRSDDGLGSPAGTNMTYGQVDKELNRINDNWMWNSPENHRSYWAFSPSYYSEKFPTIAQDVIEDEDAYQLNYLSFDEIIAGGKVPSATTTYTYAHETTVAHRGLISTNPAAAIASAVLAGHYEVSLNGTVQKDAAGNDLTFYTMGANSDGEANVFFNASVSEDGDAIVSDVEGAPTMIEYMVDKETVLLLRSGDAGNYTYEPLTKDNLIRVFDALEIVRPSDAVYKELGEYSASRTVTLQITDLGMVQANYALCINVGNGAQEIGDGENQIALVDANATLARATQWANRYNEGRAFFNIPIRHLGWYAGDNPNADASNSSIDYSAARVGDFGLVRNHVYNLSVTSIKGLGTAVSEPEDPIVPPIETVDYYVAYKLNILNWAIVPQQDIEL